jgi:Bacterial toxin 44
VWMGARWYQPNTGTFVSRDTVAGGVGAYASMNRFTYGLNNPVLFNDPTGRVAAPVGCDNACHSEYLQRTGELYDDPKDSFNDRYQNGDRDATVTISDDADGNPVFVVSNDVGITVSTATGTTRTSFGDPVAPVVDLVGGVGSGLGRPESFVHDSGGPGGKATICSSTNQISGEICRPNTNPNPNPEKPIKDMGNTDFLTIAELVAAKLNSDPVQEAIKRIKSIYWEAKSVCGVGFIGALVGGIPGLVGLGYCASLGKQFKDEFSALVGIGNPMDVKTDIRAAFGYGKDDYTVSLSPDNQNWVADDVWGNITYGLISKAIGMTMIEAVQGARLASNGGFDDTRDEYWYGIGFSLFDQGGTITTAGALSGALINGLVGYQKESQTNGDWQRANIDRCGSPIRKVERSPTGVIRPMMC